MLRAVLDANIVVSAALSAKGPPAKVLEALAADRFDLVISVAILDEFSRVFFYPKINRRLGWSDDDVAAALDALRRMAEVVPGELTLGSVVADDPKDDPYVECAVEGAAGFVVTGDKHLLELERYGEVRFVTARTFLEVLAEAERTE